MLTRIVLFALLISSAFLLPWWVTLLIGIGIAFYRFAPEIVFAGLILDGFMYPPFTFITTDFFYTFVFVGIIIGVSFLKRSLILYTRG